MSNILSGLPLSHFLFEQLMDVKSVNYENLEIDQATGEHTFTIKVKADKKPGTGHAKGDVLNAALKENDGGGGGKKPGTGGHTKADTLQQAANGNE